MLLVLSARARGHYTPSLPCFSFASTNQQHATSPTRGHGITQRPHKALVLTCPGPSACLHHVVCIYICRRAHATTTATTCVYVQILPLLRASLDTQIFQGIFIFLKRKLVYFFFGKIEFLWKNGVSKLALRVFFLEHPWSITNAIYHIEHTCHHSFLSTIL